MDSATPIASQLDMDSLEYQTLLYKLTSAEEQLRLFLQEKRDRDILLVEEKKACAHRDVCFGLSIAMLHLVTNINAARLSKKLLLQAQGCRIAVLSLSLAARRMEDADSLRKVIARKRHARNGKAFYLRSSAVEAFHDFLSLNPTQFYEHLRMTKETFYVLSIICEPFFRRHPRTPGRKPTQGRVRLLQVLRILAQSTSSFRTEAIVSKASASTLYNLWLPGVCKVLTRAIPLLRNPAKEDSVAWRERARGFRALQHERSDKDSRAAEDWRRNFAPFWGGFDDVVELFDGVVTPLAEMPRHYGVDADEFRHWKKGWSMNTMAGVDANGRFTTLATGFPGRASDEGMLSTLGVFKANEGEEGCDPHDMYPAGCSALGDSGFALRVWLNLPFSTQAIMKSQGDERNAMKLFNYKLSQLRAVVEQSFGRLKGRWRILKRIPVSPEIAGDVIEACCCLHNFLEKRGGNDVLPHWMDQIEAEEAQEDAEARLRALAEIALAAAENREVRDEGAEDEARRNAQIAGSSSVAAKEARLDRFRKLVDSVRSGGTSISAQDSGDVIATTPASS